MSQTGSDRSRLQVLVVDDDADQREVVQRLFARTGITAVRAAPDATAALAACHELAPDLVVLDLAMPGRSGLEVLPDLREAAPRASVVVLSNLPRRRVESKVLGRGAVGFVEKAVPPARLVREILVAAALTELAAAETALELPADPRSSSAARRAVRDVLGTLDPDDRALAADVELLVSELVTNAVLHASSAPRLAVRVESDVVRVEVYDADPTLPVLRTPDAERAGGRGMHLVTSLATRWGAEPHEGGKVVWFEVSRSGTPASGTSASGTSSSERPG